MEKEFLFLRLVQGTKKDGSRYAFLDYVSPTTFEPLKLWYSDKPIEFANLQKKLTKGKELTKFTGLVKLDDHNRFYFYDIK